MVRQVRGPPQVESPPADPQATKSSVEIDQLPVVSSTVIEGRVHGLCFFCIEINRRIMYL